MFFKVQELKLPFLYLEDSFFPFVYQTMELAVLNFYVSATISIALKSFLSLCVSLRL